MPKSTLIDTLKTTAADAKLGLIDLLGKVMVHIMAHISTNNS